MADKDRERKAVDVILKHMPELKGFTDISGKTQERPDFVYSKGKEIVGLEHIELPILPMNGQNAELYYNNKAIRLYDDWKDTYSSNYEGALKAMQDHINARLGVYGNFTYNEYLRNSANLLGVDPTKKRKHNATAYIHELKAIYPDCNIRICFVLDIGYFYADLSHYRYRSAPDEQFHTQRLLDFPFTWVFLMLLRMIKDVSTIYVVWHPFNDYNSKYVKYYDLHYNENHEFTLDSTSYPIPRIWWEFDMPEGMKHAKVKINLKKDEDE